jgi:hypothetical protein
MDGEAEYELCAAIPGTRAARESRNPAANLERAPDFGLAGFVRAPE